MKENNKYELLKHTEYLEELGYVYMTEDEESLSHGHHIFVANEVGKRKIIIISEKWDVLFRVAKVLSDGEKRETKLPMSSEVMYAIIQMKERNVGLAEEQAKFKMLDSVPF